MSSDGLTGEYTFLQLSAVAIAFLALLTAPLWGSEYLFPLTVATIWAIFAMSWDILSGYTGYISFGHSLLSGAAAYTTGLVLTHVGPEIPVFVTIPLSIAVALVVGLVFALPSLRLRGPYFSLVTLIAVLLALSLVRIFNEYTRGERGLVGIPDLISFDPTIKYYTAFVPMVVIAAALVYIARSNIGTVFKAIRENEESVQQAGISTTRFKLFAFVISTIPMALGGVLLTHFYGQVSPGVVLDIEISIEIIAMVIIGGIGTILGPLFGALFFSLFRELVVTNHLGPAEANIAMWGVVLLILIITPQGLVVYLWRKLGRLDVRSVGRSGGDEGG